METTLPRTATTTGTPAPTTTTTTTVVPPGAAYDVYIGRHIIEGYTAVRCWGNPFVTAEAAKHITRPGTYVVPSVSEAVALYEIRMRCWLDSCPHKRAELIRLAGKRLGGCGCPPGGGDCYGEVLIRLVEEYGSGGNGPAHS